MLVVFIPYIFFNNLPLIVIHGLLSISPYKLPQVDYKPKGKNFTIFATLPLEQCQTDSGQ
jgi:hypothetical protein